MKLTTANDSHHPTASGPVERGRGGLLRPLPPDYMVIPGQINIAEWCTDRHVQAGRGDRVAIYDGDWRYTYSDLTELTNRFGNALKSLGVSPGDHVVIRLGMTIECMIAMLGAMKIGAIPAPTSIMLGGGELEYILDNADAVAVVTAEDLAGAVREARDRYGRLRQVIVVGEPEDGELSWDALMDQAKDTLVAAPTPASDIAYMLYTSGSTGKPKGVERAHRVLPGGADPIMKYCADVNPDDIVLLPHQDLSFSYPMGQGFMFPLYIGCGLVLTPIRTGGKFDPELIFKAVERHRVTLLASVATVYRRLLGVPDAEHRFDCSSLRCCWTSAEPLPPDTLFEWRERFGLDILEMIGQSEIPSFIGNSLGDVIKPGSMGKAFPGIPVSIIDDSGNRLGPNQQGYLVIGADHPGLCSGYRKMPERWAEVFHDGWYYTLDYAYYDEDGYYWYVSRVDDLIKSRGYSISPKEVEVALMCHPAVQEAGVTGVPDRNAGQLVRAFAMLRPGYSPSPELATELRQFVKDQIAAYKAPHEIIFVPELPKTTSGKLMRRALAEIPVR